MHFLLMVPVFFLVSAVHGYLQLYAPSSMLITWIRMSPPRWRYLPLLAGLAAATLIAMHLLAEAVADGAPGWLNLIVLILAWDTIKFALLAVHELVRVVYGCLLGLPCVVTKSGTARASRPPSLSDISEMHLGHAPIRQLRSLGHRSACSSGPRAGLTRFRPPKLRP